MKLKALRFATLALFAVMAGRCYAVPAADSTATNNRDRSFDSGWRFLRADAPGAEVAGFDDGK